MRYLTFLLLFGVLRGWAQGLSAPPANRPPAEAGRSAAEDYIGVYQRFISGIRGQDCPMYPSCSNFGLQAFRTRPFAAAVALTTDRLLRCGHEHAYYPLTLRPAGMRLLDVPGHDSAATAALRYRRPLPVFAFQQPRDTARLAAVRFIRSLINEEYYQEALLEIRRVLAQPGAVPTELYINELVCLKALGLYEKGLYEFGVTMPPAVRRHPEAVFEAATLHYRLGNYRQALDLAEQALQLSPDAAFQAKVQSLRGVLYGRLGQWPEAQAAFAVQAASGYQPAGGAANARLLAPPVQLRRRSPALAGVLSVVPGGGYAYAGHYQTAISAVLINGLMAYATYSNLARRNYGMAALTGVFGLSFYAGNFYGGIRSARRFNENQRQRLVDKLEYNARF